ncbi:MAG: carbohydrate kinase family protein [Saprospiraceae bacterium]
MNKIANSRRHRRFDIISVGELLVDFISKDFANSLYEAKDFKRLQGGSPANLSMNMARLGNTVKLIATVGQDDMGQYLLNCVESLAVDCTHLARIDTPTSLILITRSKEVSNFEAYRAADCHITEDQLSESHLSECSLFHTTCFALSKAPAQQAILKGATFVAKTGGQLSIDANYAQKIWPNQEEAQSIVAQYCSLGALVKVSEVDWQRLYNDQFDHPETAAAHFLGMGAQEVCITLGGEGCFVASQAESYFLPARKIEVKDSTGAGDAFWAGYLTAWLDGSTLLDRAIAGRKMAELKLTCFGALPAQVARQEIYQDLMT